MLGHRLRRWPNINSALDQCVVFVEQVIPLVEDELFSAPPGELGWD